MWEEGRDLRSLPSLPAEKEGANPGGRPGPPGSGTPDRQGFPHARRVGGRPTLPDKTGLPVLE